MIEDYLRQHDGVITLAQAELAGLSRHSVNRRVRTGRWVRCSPGVYFVDDRPYTDAARIRAAVWGRGSNAVGSGLAAAWWHGITKYAPGVVEVTVPRNAHRLSGDGYRTRRRDLERADIVERRGLRITELGLTAVEAATRRGGGVGIMDSALQRHTDLNHLWQAHLRNKGRHGAPAARRLLQAADGGARSEAERLFKRLLVSAGITGWKANQRIAGHEVDFLFKQAKVVVEIDGLAVHSGTDDFHHDRVKQNAMALAGFQVLRFTWLDLNEFPGRAMGELMRAIRGV